MPSQIWMLTRFLVALAGLTGLNAVAQMSQPLLGENTTKISDHVWAVMGFPNVAIVVGQRATLVVDTGLGPRNGATIARRSQAFRKSEALPHNDALPPRACSRRRRFSTEHDSDTQRSPAAGNGKAWGRDD